MILSQITLYVCLLCVNPYFQNCVLKVIVVSELHSTPRNYEPCTIMGLQMMLPFTISLLKGRQSLRQATVEKNITRSQMVSASCPKPHRMLREPQYAIERQFPKYLQKALPGLL